MAGSTDHYGLSQLTAGDSLADNGYKHTDADRETIDSILFQGAEGHRHTGAAGAIEEPDTAPTLSLDSSGGVIPAATRVYYKYTLVSPVGHETTASPEAFVDTPAAIQTPSSPVVSHTSTGGVLQGGGYYYTLSAYVDASTNETRAQNPAFYTVPSTTGTNEITLTLPDPEVGQTGFNIYRRAPGQGKYFFLASVVTDQATPPTSYVDDGLVAEDCDRGLPVSNTTNASNSITVTMPGATPTVPEGYTWRLYRTYVSGAWSASYLTSIVEPITLTSTFTVPTFIDVGLGTQTGTYPATSLLVGNPSKVDMSDAMEVQGTLPMGLVSAFPYVATLIFPGTVTYGEREVQWVSPFENATVISAVASLGRAAPASSDIIMDVVVGTNAATPVFNSVYLTQADMPKIIDGNDRSNVMPATAGAVDRSVGSGDVITANTVYFPGSATPTDSNMTISVLLYVQVSSTTSYDWTV